MDGFYLFGTIAAAALSIAFIVSWFKTAKNIRLIKDKLYESEIKAMMDSPTKQEQDDLLNSRIATWMVKNPGKVVNDFYKEILK
jgi:galactose-1-phosphate uridylyltransferase